MHIVGLDAIRLIAAAVVALGHFHVQFEPALTPILGARAAQLADAALGNLFNGPAAVVVFFVLSGLVIHLPYHNGKPFALGEFAARRYIRIIPPMLVFMLVAFALGRPLDDWDWNNTILWSVVCELIYYTMYPLLRKLPISFLTMTLIGFGISALVGVVGWEAIAASNMEYTVFGYFTFVIGLPIWLAGCALAEFRMSFRVVTPFSMWSMRAGIVLLSIVLRVMKFHGEPYVGIGASNVYMLTAFAIPAAIWLGFESRYYEQRSNRVVRVLDKGGSASYSLYLVHTLVLTALALVIPLGDPASFVLYVLLAGLATWLFYLAVERPSHLLAQRLGRSLAPTTAHRIRLRA